ncbi:hypothetical protein BCON_0105g00090 [Botryotinia convoluta]|uniref:Uncharacterized protein n=1 Tax=Botryotinia convoluta TaxID=54673 RepID=A0A4Z1HZ77_9HELO|nr:hypothetical protein BCON_0105g00090 [Botryotinia convoluta]
MILPDSFGKVPMQQGSSAVQNKVSEAVPPHFVQEENLCNQSGDDDKCTSQAWARVLSRQLRFADAP